MRTVNPISPLHRKPRTEELANRYDNMCSDNMCSIITDRPNGKWNSRPDIYKKDNATVQHSGTPEQHSGHALLGFCDAMAGSHARDK